MDDKLKNDKLKNDAPRINNMLFLVLWIAGHVASWMLAIGVNQVLISQRIFIQSQFLLGMLMALGTGIPTAVAQLLLVERGLKKSMRGWLPVSVIGWGLSGLAIFWLWTNIIEIATRLPEPIAVLLPRFLFVPLFVPVALLQWLWLRRKVSSAGLWVLAAVAGSLLFSMLRVEYYIGGGFYTTRLTEFLVIAGAALLYSDTTGATMLHLWTRPQSKAKPESAVAQQSNTEDAERLVRLADQSDDAQMLLPEIRHSTSSAKPSV